MIDRISTRETLTAYLVASIENTPRPLSEKFIEAVSTLRELEANAGLVADLHGVTLDQPVGFECASQIVTEACASIAARIAEVRR